MFTSDACTFDIFTNSVKPARNAKKELKAFIKKRSQYSISNLKLPKLGDEDRKFKPTKNAEPVENSGALLFSKQRTQSDRMVALQQENANLNNILKDIRESLITGTRKMKTISPELIDQINRFEILTDFTNIA